MQILPSTHCVLCCRSLGPSGSHRNSSSPNLGPRPTVPQRLRPAGTEVTFLNPHSPPASPHHHTTRYPYLLPSTEAGSLSHATPRFTSHLHVGHANFWPHAAEVNARRLHVGLSHPWIYGCAPGNDKPSSWPRLYWKFPV